jgi:hypothetical protein
MTRTGTFGVSALFAFLGLVLPSTIVALSTSKEELQPVIEWVQAEGIPNTLQIEVAEGFGLRPPIPYLSKTFRMDSGAINSFGVVTANGRREIILQRVGPTSSSTQYQGWRMSEEGKVIKTVVVDKDGDLTTRDGLTDKDFFEMVLNFFLGKVRPEKSQ